MTRYLPIELPRHAPSHRNLSSLALLILVFGGTALADVTLPSRELPISPEQFQIVEFLACQKPHSVSAERNTKAKAVDVGGGVEELSIDVRCMAHQHIEGSPVFHTASCRRKSDGWSCSQNRRLMEFTTPSSTVTIESKKVPLKEALRAVKYVASIPEFKGRNLGPRGVGSYCKASGKKNLVELDCEHYRFYVDTTPLDGKPRMHLFEMVQ
jgi:hypothetical protein